MQIGFASYDKKKKDSVYFKKHCNWLETLFRRDRGCILF